MSLRVETYRDEQEIAWDQFVRDESRNGGIFQERKFLAYHPKDRFKDCSLLFHMDNRLFGILPAARVIGADGSDEVISHPGSTAGGLVFHRTAILREVLAMLESAISLYRADGAKRLEFRLAEPIFSHPSDGELAYVLWHRGFQLRTREVSSCVDLTSAQNWLSLGREKNPGTIRSLLRKGITAQRADDPSEVYRLIAENLDQRYQKRPTHSAEEFAEIKARYPDRIHYWVVRVDGVAVATVVVFIVNHHAVHDFYIAQNYAYAKLNVMPLLFYTAFDYYRQAGFRWFNFGISSRGDWIKWGILEFKERMGGRATFRDVWSYEHLAAYRPYQALEASLP